MAETCSADAQRIELPKAYSKHAFISLIVEPYGYYGPIAAYYGRTLPEGYDLDAVIVLEAKRQNRRGKEIARAKIAYLSVDVPKDQGRVITHVDLPIRFAQDSGTVYTALLADNSEVLVEAKSIQRA